MSSRLKSMQWTLSLHIDRTSIYPWLDRRKIAKFYARMLHKNVFICAETLWDCSQKPLRRLFSKSWRYGRNGNFRHCRQLLLILLHTIVASMVILIIRLRDRGSIWNNKLWRRCFQSLVCGWMLWINWPGRCAEGRGRFDGNFDC